MRLCFFGVILRAICTLKAKAAGKKNAPNEFGAF
jgi:hypothetical protein